MLFEIVLWVSYKVLFSATIVLADAQNFLGTVFVLC